MFNSWAEANASRKKLEKTVKQRLQYFRPVQGWTSGLEFHLAYASDKDGLGSTFKAQLLEAYYQKKGSLTESFWRSLAGIEASPQWFQNMMVSLAGVETALTYVMDADFQSMLNGTPLASAQGARFEGYKHLLGQGKRVLIVSHSQGNFYANAVYNTLSAQYGASIGNVQVATPASYVASGGPHLTLNEDLIITPITSSLQSTPVWGDSRNMGELGQVAWFKAFLGHNFVNWYLAGTFSRNTILNDIIQTIPLLTFPVQTITNTGPITVTLWWGSATDVDLHVFEASGSHVYYANRQGMNGALDVDNTWGYGPEHYYASCSSIQAGTYAVGVNYFSGVTRPETVTISIDTEDGGSYRYYKSLTAPRGGTGNAIPMPVANIVVTNNLQGGFNFAVQ